MATPSLDCLPPEILSKVFCLGFHTEKDLNFLWNECRNVSKYWRALVEDFVQRHHLSKSMIRYDLEINDLDKAIFEFAGLHPDNNEIAVYAQTWQFEISSGETMKKIAERVKDGGSTYWTRPPHVVSVRRFCNDTEIPGIHIDIENYEIHCDWKGMFNALFSEYKYCSTLWAKSSKEIEKIRREDFDMGFYSHSEMYRDIKLRNATYARSKRISRQLELNCQSLYAPINHLHDEARAARMIKQHEDFSGFMEFSDDDVSADEGDEFEEDQNQSEHYDKYFGIVSKVRCQAKELEINEEEDQSRSEDYDEDFGEECNVIPEAEELEFNEAEERAEYDEMY